MVVPGLDAEADRRDVEERRVRERRPVRAFLADGAQGINLKPGAQ